MPFFKDTPSLSVTYTTNSTSYLYNVLSLSDYFPDVNQLKVVWATTEVYIDNVLTAVSTLSPTLRNKVQNIPPAAYTVDDVAKTITPNWSGYERDIDGQTYRYTNNVVVSSTEPLYIIRSQEISEASVDFQPGSRLTSDQLNTSFLQNFLAIQELAFSSDDSDLTNTQEVSFISDLNDALVNTSNIGSILYIDDDNIIKDTASANTAPSINLFNDVNYSNPDLGQFLGWSGTQWVPQYLPFGLNSFSVTTDTATDNASSLAYDGQGGFTFTPMDSAPIIRDSDSIQRLGDVETRDLSNPVWDRSLLAWDDASGELKWSNNKAFNNAVGTGPWIYGGEQSGTPSSTFTSDRLKPRYNGNDVTTLYLSTQYSKDFDVQYFRRHLYWAWRWNNYVVVTSRNNSTGSFKAKVTAVADSSTNEYLYLTLDVNDQSAVNNSNSTVTPRAFFEALTSGDELIVSCWWDPTEGALEDLGNVSGTPLDGELLAYSSTNNRWEPLPPTDIVDTSSVTLSYVQVVSRSSNVSATTFNLTQAGTNSAFDNAVASGDQTMVSALDTDNREWVAPEDMRILLNANVSVRAESGDSAGTNKNIDLYVTVNGTQVSSDAKFRTDVEADNDSNPVSLSQVLDLTAGDELKITCDISGGNTFRIGEFQWSLVRLDVDTTLLLDPDARITARPVTQNLSSDEVVIGVNQDGYPIYERYIEQTNDWTLPASHQVFWDYDNEQNELIPTDVTAEIVRAYDATGTANYLADTSSSLFGFYLYTFNNELRVDRSSNAPTTGNFGANSIIGVIVRYTKTNLDNPDAQYIIATPGVSGFTGVTSVNGDSGPDVVLSGNEIRVLAGTENPFISDSIADLETSVSSLESNPVLPALTQGQVVIGDASNNPVAADLTSIANRTDFLRHPDGSLLPSSTQDFLNSNANWPGAGQPGDETPGALGAFGVTEQGIEVMRQDTYLDMGQLILGGSGLLSSNNLSDLTNVTTARTNLSLGTSATLDVGTAANNIVQLDGSARLPAVDGSQLTNLPVVSSLPASSLTSGSLSIDLIPDSDNTRDIGSSDYRWAEIHGNLDGAVHFRAKNDAGRALVVGDIVYINGSTGVDTPNVALARSSDSSRMPAFGMISTGGNDQAEVYVTTLGSVTGVNLPSTTYSVGDEIYVHSVPGQFTNTAPTGESKLIQKIGKVTKVNSGGGTNGVVKIMGAGRTNAVPNLDQDKVFLGNASNQAASTALSAINLSKFNNDLSLTDYVSHPVDTRWKFFCDFFQVTPDLGSNDGNNQFWMMGGGNQVSPQDQVSSDARGQANHTLGGNHRRYAYWGAMILNDENRADGDELLWEARVYFTDTNATTGTVALGVVDRVNTLNRNDTPPNGGHSTFDYAALSFNLAETNARIVDKDTGAAGTATGVQQLTAMTNFVNTWFRIGVHCKFNNTNSNWDIDFYIDGTKVGSTVSMTFDESIVPYVGISVGGSHTGNCGLNIDWISYQGNIGQAISGRTTTLDIGDL